jgi:niacin transporter
MEKNSNLSVTHDMPVLAFYSTRAIILQLTLIVTAVLLPSILHIINAPVRIILPMHWPVILAGLIYGWRSGLVVGLLSPIISYLFSGFPLPNILPSMTLELASYGFMTGILRERQRCNVFLSVLYAIIVGRVVFICSIYLFRPISIDFIIYIRDALTPGIFTAILQIIIIPIIARWWIYKEFIANEDI